MDELTIDLDRVYDKYYRRRNYWEEEIRHIMWEAALTARKRYIRFSVNSSFEEYAECVITESVNKWISENGRYAFGILSLNQTFRDSDNEVFPTYLKYEDNLCSFELNDFIYRLGRMKYQICKWYITYHTDEAIIKRLCITRKRLEEIKRELQEDFRRGYLI